MSAASIAQFTNDLRRLPKVVAQSVAKRAAPAITALARASFDASETPDGVPWAPAKDGDKVTLRKTGDLERFIHYVSIGTKLRVALGVPYAKYQIGKRPVYPTQGGTLPREYRETLARTAVAVVREEMAGFR